MFFLQVSCEWVVPINNHPILGFRYKHFDFRLQKYQFFVINANVLGKISPSAFKTHKCLGNNFVNVYVGKNGKKCLCKKELPYFCIEKNYKLYLKKL